MWHSQSYTFSFFFPHFATSIIFTSLWKGLYDMYRKKKSSFIPLYSSKLITILILWNWKFDDIIEGGSGSRSTKESYYLSCHYLSSACPLKKSLSSSSLLIERSFSCQNLSTTEKSGFPRSLPSRKLNDSLSAVEENFHLQLKGIPSILETHVANEGTAFGEHGFERLTRKEGRT